MGGDSDFPDLLGCLEDPRYQSCWPWAGHGAGAQVLPLTKRSCCFEEKGSSEQRKVGRVPRPPSKRGRRLPRCWTALPSIGARGLLSELYGNTVLLRENLGLGWEGSGGRGRRHFQNTSPLPRPYSRRTLTFSPSGPAGPPSPSRPGSPCKGWWGKMRRHYWGGGPMCFYFLSLPGAGPQPCLRAVGPWHVWHRAGAR